MCIVVPFRLKLGLPDVVAMQTRQANLEGTGEIQLRRLVKEALRMRPDRIVVGEVRQEECLDLLIALNSGLPGMCTLHANSAREAIVKLCTLPLLAGENVGHRFAQPSQHAQAVELRRSPPAAVRCWIDLVETARQGGEGCRTRGRPNRVVTRRRSRSVRAAGRLADRKPATSDQTGRVA